MERKLDVGGTLNSVFSIYGQQAGVLLPVAFVLYLIVAVISGLLDGSLILIPISIAIGMIAATLYQGMVVELVHDVQDGQKDSSVGDLFDSILPVLAPLIGAGILAGIGIGIGFLILVVPGLILMTIWAVIAPAIVVEHCGVLEAFGRSRELVRGNGWQVFGVIVVIFLISFFASIILSAIGTSISDGPLIRILFGLAASTLTAPLTALAAASIYFGLLGVKGDGQPSAGDPGAYQAPPSYPPQAPAPGVQPPQPGQIPPGQSPPPPPPPA